MGILETLEAGSIKTNEKTPLTNILAVSTQFNKVASP